MGYSLAQTLFLGPNCLLVEGPSDLLYLQTMSAILSDMKREVLSDKWVITPVGGADKLATFVSLIGANELNVCVLMDISKKDIQRVDNLARNHFLDRNKIIQLNEFVDGKEADIEDLFSAEEYISLVKYAYPAIKDTLIPEKLGKSPRIVKQLEKYFSSYVSDANFNHFAPSRAELGEFGELGNSINVSQETVDRFEHLFERVNGLLPTE